MNEANAYSVESYLASNLLIKQVLALSKYYSSCLCDFYKYQRKVWKNWRHFFVYEKLSSLVHMSQMYKS